MALPKRLVPEAKRLLREGSSVRNVAHVLECSRGGIQEIVDQERSRVVRKYFVILAIVSACFVAVVGLWSYRLSTSLPASASLKQYGHQIAQAVNHRATPDRWLLDKEGVPEQINKEVSLIEKLTRDLEQSLDRHKDVPEVAQLQRQFQGKLFATIFANGASKIVQRTAPKMEQFPGHSNGMEIVFYAKGDANHPQLSGHELFYNPNWGACMVPMLEYPDLTWRDALFLHELWHAKLDREGAASAHAPMLSEAWISEELDAHDVETRVLNAGTGGRYFRQLNRIAGGSQAASVEDFLSQVAPAQVIDMEQLFQPPLQGEAGLRSAQYLLDLGRAWLEGHYQGQELRQRELDFYRLITGPQITG